MERRSSEGLSSPEQLNRLKRASQDSEGREWPDMACITVLAGDLRALVAAHEGREGHAVDCHDYQRHFQTTSVERSDDGHC